MKHLKNMNELRTGALYIRVYYNHIQVYKVMSKPRLIPQQFLKGKKIWKIDILEFSQIQRFNEKVNEWFISDFGVERYTNTGVRVYPFSHKTLNKLRNMSNKEIYYLCSSFTK